jgi:hypothetical protein
MAKRSSTAQRTSEPASSLERQVIAFAEQLGYVAGSIQSRTEGLVDRKALSRQVASVRDGAKHLLDQLATGVASRVRRAPVSKKPVRRARSGGTVDAPGKRHRKPPPAGASAAVTRTQAAKLRTAAPMAKTFRRRARQG